MVGYTEHEPTIFFTSFYLFYGQNKKTFETGKGEMCLRVQREAFILSPCVKGAVRTIADRTRGMYTAEKGTGNGGVCYVKG